MSEELKPCPFCGSDKVEVWDDGSFIYVLCDNCRTSSSYLYYQNTREESKRTQEVIKAWNTRAERTCRWTPIPDVEGAYWVECLGGSEIDLFGDLPTFCGECGGKIVVDYE